MDQRIYWCLIALRRAHSPESQAFCRACRAYPKLKEFSSGGFVDITAIHDLLTSLTLERAHNRTLEEVHSSPDDPGKRHSAAQLGRWIALWSSKRRKICSLSILGPDGTPATTREQSAKYLFDHWSEVFRDKPVNLGTAWAAISTFIQRVPDDINWDPCFERFYEALCARKDTGAGPDGIPYSFWSLAPMEFARAIYDNYVSLKQGGSPAPDFNDSKVVFPAKGKEASDFTCCFTRPPQKTRPLSLSNTDNKSTSTLVSFPLNEVASKTVHVLQTGGIKGRIMVDNIINLEAKAIQFMITHALLSGIFALGQAAAFPSISRAYIYWVLKRMHFPRRIRRISKLLYTGGKSWISFGGRTHMSFTASSGVKQGDPSSMVIFVICFDPILRWINSLLAPIGDFMFGYCDDVGIASRNLLISWPIIKKCFHIVGRISALWLNIGKTQCCIIFASKFTYIKGVLLEIDDSLMGACFADFVKYLGIHLGPGALAIAWDEAILKYQECAKFLSGIDAGFIPTIYLYNVLCVSITSWIGSFLPPSDKLLTLESKTLQRILRCPWNVFPKALLLQLKTLGLTTQYQSITVNSISSRVRNAHTTSDEFWRIASDIDNCLQSDERLLRIQVPSWLSGCCITSMRDANVYVTSLGASLSPPVIQSSITQHIQSSLPPFDLQPFFCKRIARLTNIEDIDYEHTIGSIRAIGKKFKPCFVSSYVLTIFNGWCTRR